MRQALDCLQLSAPELDNYIEELALSNPLLDVQSPTWYETQLPGEAPAAYGEIELRGAENWFIPHTPSAGDVSDLGAYLTKETSFRDYLNEQIGQMKLVDDKLLELCRYLIGCLNERGYLDCPLEELAGETGCSLFELEQALYAVQMLDPPGVGARSLSECLILQLTQGRSFNRLTLAIARDGLELLAKRDHSGLAALLNASVSEVKKAEEEILSLSPIPARGFADDEPTACIAPDAVFRVEQGGLVIELNESILPRLSVNAEYAALLAASDDAEVRRYGKEKRAEAQGLIKSVHTRCDTLLHLITLLGDIQKDYFLRGGTLVPVTMQQLAEQMGVSVSTVSRAAQNKYIQFQGKVIPLRSFFTAAIRTDAEVSAQMVCQRIRTLIKAEDPADPLSDEELRAALSGFGISVSRRAVAKYRMEMNIPSSTGRRAR